MRPVREIPSEFFNLRNELGEPLPLIERFAAFVEGQRPLQGFRRSISYRIKPPWSAC